MPITLTSAFDPGAFDEGNTYAEAKVLRFEMDTVNKRLDILFSYGATPASDFVVGAAARKERITVQNGPGTTEFDDFVNQATLDGETFWEAGKRLVYSHMQTMEPTKLAGTVA